MTGIIHPPNARLPEMERSGNSGMPSKHGGSKSIVVRSLASYKGKKRMITFSYIA